MLPSFVMNGQQAVLLLDHGLVAVLVGLGVGTPRQ